MMGNDTSLATGESGPVEGSILRKLQRAYEPAFMMVVNESHKHSVPKDSESHFKLVIVTDRFAGRKTLARHQAVYQLLKEEMQGPVHAMSIEAFTPEEWEQQDRKARPTPECLGGSKLDRR